ncbi:MAG TPA: phenylpyruvate tautomerase MIF-related protein [Polyangiaceae bacterium]|nr:phenylpyruvate tautomerase MIF-related protein [Polyangiaceae bacterium]
MPLVTVYTSAEPPPEEKSTALLRELSSTAAGVLGKPESYVMACLVPRSRMSFAGSFKPSCLVEIKSIGGLAGDRAARLTEAVCKLAAAALGVPARRIYVVFTDVPATLWGFDGKTFG